uniref:Uncharacterized protein n=1 Tax=Romanomermis culicivorax TaxID=13658 RepID=A0A915K3J3_ROMCU
MKIQYNESVCLLKSSIVTPLANSLTVRPRCLSVSKTAISVMTTFTTFLPVNGKRSKIPRQAGYGLGFNSERRTSGRIKASSRMSFFQSQVNDSQVTDSQVSDSHGQASMLYQSPDSRAGVKGRNTSASGPESFGYCSL